MPVMTAAGAEKTKEQLLDAAEELFAESGFDGVGVREIGHKAGANSALINYHFGSKAGLYEAVIERRMTEGKEILASARAMVQSSSDVELTPEVVEVTLRTVLRNFVQHMQTRPAFVRLMTREVSAGFPVARRIVQRLMPLQPLAELITRAQETGVVRKDLDPRRVTFLMFGMHQHFLANAHALKGLGIDCSKAEVMDEIIDMNMSIIFNGIWNREREQ